MASIERDHDKRMEMYKEALDMIGNIAEIQEGLLGHMPAKMSEIENDLFTVYSKLVRLRYLERNDHS